MERGEGGSGLIAVLATALVLSACTGAATVANEPTIATTSTSTSTTTTSVVTTTTSTSIPQTTSTSSTTTTVDLEAASECPVWNGKPFEESQSVKLRELGTVNGVGVSGAIYPRPDYEGDPWSQWGQGIVLEDGRFFSAIGDHLGPDGNSYIYEYDPATDRLTLVADVLSHIDHVEGTWGYGKIHSQMVPGPCGEFYFSTHWGSSRDLEFNGNYTGDVLFRLDPNARTLQALGVPVPFHGQASLAADPSRNLIYGEALDPLTRESDPRGPLFVYDVFAEEVIYTSSPRPHVGFRSLLTDANGNPHYSTGDGELNVYDPEVGETRPARVELPGDWLRAVTEPSSEGVVYGVTREPDTFFSVGPEGDLRVLGDALGYTTSIALSPDESVFYYMPGAHGNSSKWDSPLIAVDVEDGDQNVIVKLNRLVENELGHTVGGTYNIAVTPDGSRVFMGVNTALEGDGQDGEVILLVIDLP